MTVKYDVSVKDMLGFVMHGLADQSQLSEGVDITVDTHHADQLSWQSSSFQDGQCVRGRRDEVRGRRETCRGGSLLIAVSECMEVR